MESEAGSSAGEVDRGATIEDVTDTCATSPHGFEALIVRHQRLPFGCRCGLLCSADVPANGGHHGVFRSLPFLAAARMVSGVRGVSYN